MSGQRPPSRPPPPPPLPPIALPRRPARPKPAARRREQRRDAILAAAIRIVAERGHAALSLAALADAVDLSPAALYHHFPHRDAIVAAVAGRTLDDVRSHVRGAVGALGLAPARLRSLAVLLIDGDGLAAAAASAPRLLALLALLAVDPSQLAQPGAMAPLAVALAEQRAELRGWLQDAEACGALEGGDDEQRASMWFGSWIGMLSVRPLPAPGPQRREQPSPAAPNGHIGWTLLRGWGASEAELRQAGRLARDAIAGAT